MISDEERRRAVAELREASTGAYRHVDSLDVIAGAVGVELDGKFGHEIENETYAALADLIDRPTCSLKPIENAIGRVDLVYCSECKETFKAWEVEDFRYCPSCGAEVES